MATSKLKFEQSHNLKLSLKNSYKFNSPTNQTHSNNGKHKSNDIYLMQVCGNIKKASKTREFKTKEQSLADFKLACLNSEQTISIFDENLFKKSQIIDAHIDTIINEVEFFKCDQNLLLTCGDDSLVKCWDLRNPRKEVIKYDLTNDLCKLLSVDIDCADQLIASSTSNNDDNNSFIYFFDIKMSNKVLKKYSDAHSNDITQVKFDSMNKNRLISASIDGLACVFDLLNLKTDVVKAEQSSSDESVDDDDDDLIDQVYNTNSSIQKIGYLNANSQYMYAITFTNDLFIWNMDTQDEIYKLSLYNSNKPSDYIIDCFNANQSPNEIITCFGDRHGNLQFYDLNDRLLFNTNSIRASNKHHSDLIRSVFWNYYANELYSIGEDGILNKWKLDLEDNEEEEDDSEAKGKTKRLLKNSDKSDDDEDDKKVNKKQKLSTGTNNKIKKK